MVILLCVVCAIMLWLFVFYHLNLVSQGFTTNESSKHSHFKGYLKHSEGIFKQWLELKEEDPNSVPPQHILDSYKLSPDMDIK